MLTWRNLFSPSNYKNGYALMDITIFWIAFVYGVCAILSTENAPVTGKFPAVNEGRKSAVASEPTQTDDLLTFTILWTEIWQCHPLSVRIVNFKLPFLYLLFFAIIGSHKRSNTETTEFVFISAWSLIPLPHVTRYVEIPN